MRRCSSPNSSRRCADPSAPSSRSPTAAVRSCARQMSEPCSVRPQTGGPMAANPTNASAQVPEEEQSPLERFGRDLTEIAEQGKLDPVIGRDEEIRRVIQVLSRRTKNNPVLIGEPGVGKTAIVE